MATLSTSGTPVLKNYVPQLYSPRLLMDFYEKSILAAIFNTDYQGMISKMGDTVIIRKNASINVKPWKDGDPVTYSEVSAEDVQLKIDHGCIWSFMASLLKKKQSDLAFDSAWIQDASKQVQKYTEIGCIGKILTDDLAPGNYGNTAGIDSGMYKLGTIERPVIITPKETDSTNQNASDYICDMMSVLDEQNVTNDDEQVNFVGPKIFRNRLAKSEFKKADVLGTPNTTLRFGQQSVGQVMGAHFFDSGYLRPLKNTEGKTVFPVLACTKRAASFALQFTNTWSKELEGKVAMGYRGVSVFGCKLVEPRAFAVGYVTFA